MNAEVTARVVEAELNAVERKLEDAPGEVIERGENPPSVRLKLESRIDGEVYYLEGVFDDYPQKPGLWEFYHPGDDEKGKVDHYPDDEAKHGLDTIFLDDPVICHPASRRAYAGYTGKHGGWEMKEWRTIEEDSIDSIPRFVDMILSRINSDLYNGRGAT